MIIFQIRVARWSIKWVPHSKHFISWYNRNPHTIHFRCTEPDTLDWCPFCISMRLHLHHKPVRQIYLSRHNRTHSMLCTIRPLWDTAIPSSPLWSIHHEQFVWNGHSLCFYIERKSDGIFLVAIHSVRSIFQFLRISGLMVSFDDIWFRIFVFREPWFRLADNHIADLFICYAGALDTTTSNILSGRWEHIGFPASIVSDVCPASFAVQVGQIGKFIVPLLMSKLNNNCKWRKGFGVTDYSMGLTIVAMRVAGWNPDSLPAAIWFLFLLCSSRMRSFSSCVISGMPVQFLAGVFIGKCKYIYHCDSDVCKRLVAELTVSSGHATWFEHKWQ